MKGVNNKPPEWRGTASIRVLLSGLLMLGMLLGGAACGHPPDVIEVPMELPLLVQGGLVGVVTKASLPGAGQRVSQSLGKEGISSDQVDSVTVASLKLVHIAPACSGLVGCDLSFIESLTLEASSDAGGPLLLGALQSPPAVGEVAITPEVAELKPLLGDSLHLDAALVLARQPLQTVELSLQATLRVDIKVF